MSIDDTYMLLCRTYGWRWRWRSSHCCLSIVDGDNIVAGGLLIEVVSKCYNVCIYSALYTIHGIKAPPSPSTPPLT